MRKELEDLAPKGPRGVRAPFKLIGRRVLLMAKRGKRPFRVTVECDQADAEWFQRWLAQESERLGWDAEPTVADAIRAKGARRR